MKSGMIVPQINKYALIDEFSMAAMTSFIAVLPSDK